MKKPSFQKLFTTLGFFLFTFLVPFSYTNAAAVCLCYSNDNDCIEKTTKETFCEQTCKKDLNTTYQSFEYVKIDSEVILKAGECKKKHDAIVESKRLSDIAKKEGAAFLKPNSTIFAKPELNVPIPNLKFSDPIVEQNEIRINYLGEYIDALYKYLLQISVLIAIVMVMIAGLQYVLSSHSGDVKKALTRIKNAVTGLLLLFSLALILMLINPQFLNLKSISLQNIQREGLGNNEATDINDQNANYPPVSITPGQLPNFKQCAFKTYTYKGPENQTLMCKPNKKNLSSFEDNICESGCGPTSVAAVLAFYGMQVSPPVVADFAAKIGAHTSCTTGTNVATLCKKIPSQWPNMKCKNIEKTDTKTIVNYLSQKKPLVFSCSGCSGKKQDGSEKKYRGHFMILTGIASGGNAFLVSDVASSNGIVTISLSQFTDGNVGSVYLIEKK